MTHDFLGQAKAAKTAAQRADTNGHPPLARTSGAQVTGAPNQTAWAQAILEDETAKVAAGSYRNDTLNSGALRCYRIHLAGLLDKTEIDDRFLDAGRTASSKGDHPFPDSEIRNTLRSAWNGAQLKGPADDVPEPLGGPVITEILPAPAPATTLDTILKLEEDFWKRPTLQLVYNTALARMCPPWAVLAHCTARALYLVRPAITLPALIGGPGSLNWFAVVAAASGLGKSASSAVARLLIPGVTTERNLGSGEGIIGQYRQPGTKTEPGVEHEAVLFTADEIDTVTALTQRSASTTLTVLRSAFTAETLGFSYITKGRDIHVPAGEYRMTLVLSLQPGRAGPLLADHYGGTPQRFQWFPGTDPRIPDRPDEVFITELELPPATAWQYPRTLRIPDEARDLIQTERAKTCRGENHTLDGHALFVREKFAFALAVLDGRTEMNSEDWRLSGIAAQISAATREWVQAELQNAEDEEHTKRGRARGVEMLASDEEKARRSFAKTCDRVGKWVLAKLAKEPMTNRELTQAISSRDRPLLPDVLIALHKAGKIDKDGNKIVVVP